MRYPYRPVRRPTPLRLVAHVASAAAVLTLAFAFGRWLRDPNLAGGLVLLLAAGLAGLAMRQLYRRREPVAAEAGAHRREPRRPGARRTGAARPVPADGIDHRVDLNRATLEELQQLPGVGPASAGRIAAGRPYGSIDELGRIAGFGPARIKLLEPHIRV